MNAAQTWQAICRAKARFDALSRCGQRERAEAARAEFLRLCEEYRP